MSTLAELPVDASAEVVEILGADEVSVRLLEMGLVPGTELRLLGYAPLGDPLEIEIRGYRLSLRKAEAAHVVVTRL